MFTPWRVNRLVLESEWLGAVPEGESASIRPEGDRLCRRGALWSAPIESEGTHPIEAAVKEYRADDERTYACRLHGQVTACRHAKWADPLAEWIGPRPAVDAIRTADSPGNGCKVNSVFDQNAAWVLTLSLSSDAATPNKVSINKVA
jgi:hypothetical protein